MRLFFSLFLIFFLSSPLFSKSFDEEYLIKTKGLSIGLLNWKLTIDKDSYSTIIRLKNKGLIATLYSFKGEYEAVGKINNDFFSSTKYEQLWKTKKKEKIVKIVYDKGKLVNLEMSPKEKELPRINYKKLKNYNDPITSFLNILVFEKPAYTIDGRRAYLLKPYKKNGSVKVLLEKYTNIWADHKRNDLEYIEFFLEKGVYLPKRINIMFKGSLFSLFKI